jgi:tetratricopeptide (TPR) repeat protein
MGHEIAHVKAHHYARMAQKTQIPDLLVGLAGMAAAVATREPGVLLATQAANVAVKLKFSREFENEADRLGGVFMTRAGFDPLGITRFFERILAEQKKYPDVIPPYLYSHPDVEDRIASVQQEAKSLRPTRSPDPRFGEALREVQARIAWLEETGRESVPPAAAPDDPARIAGLLSEADALAGGGRPDEALLALSRAEALEPRDPRPSYRIGEILAGQGRHREAALAWRRTLRLDPSRALVFYNLGLSYEALGERHLSVYAFEQASRRAGDASVLRRRADWQIETQIFPVFIDAGLADGERGEGETPLGNARTSFASGATRLAWWGRLASRYTGYAERISVRWLDPRGRTLGETEARPVDSSHLGSVLELPPPGAAPPGRWTAEALFEGDVLDRRHFRVD